MVFQTLDIPQGIHIHKNRIFPLNDIYQLVVEKKIQIALIHDQFHLVEQDTWYSLKDMMSNLASWKRFSSKILYMIEMVRTIFRVFPEIND